MRQDSSPGGLLLKVIGVGEPALLLGKPINVSMLTRLFFFPLRWFSFSREDSVHPLPPGMAILDQ